MKNRLPGPYGTPDARYDAYWRKIVHDLHGDKRRALLDVGKRFDLWTTGRIGRINLEFWPL